MNLISKYNSFSQSLECIVTPLILLFIRIHVSLIFFKAGILKISSWDSTMYLFTEEYRVPLLSPEIAAYVGTATELTLPILLALGIFTRFTAFAFIIFNIVAMLSYAHVFFKDGFSLLTLGALDHQLWIFMLTIVVIFGGGKYCVDRYLNIK